LTDVGKGVTPEAPGPTWFKVEMLTLASSSRMICGAGCPIRVERMTDDVPD
jgi:hypothetical protein